jgi:hypothetical protein
VSSFITCLEMMVELIEVTLGANKFEGHADIL